MGKKNPTTPPQPKAYFKNLGESISNSKPRGLDSWMLKWSCWLWETTRCLVAQNMGKKSSVVGPPVWLTIDISGIQVLWEKSNNNIIYSLQVPAGEQWEPALSLESNGILILGEEERAGFEGLNVGLPKLPVLFLL